MPSQAPPMTTCLTTGAAKGWRGFVWMLKIVVPISLATSVLAWSGWLNRLDVVLEPVMGVIGLPAVAALPLLIGITSSLFGALAAMAPLDLTTDQMTLIAIFLIISHNLIQESMVQRESGFPFLKATLIRLVPSVVTVSIASRLMGGDTAAAPLIQGAEMVRLPLATLLTAWFWNTLLLAAKILAIMVVLMTVLEVMRAYRWIDHLVGITAPILRLLGLKREMGLLWLTAALFGLSYGAAVIVEEARAGEFEGEDLERLHVSMGINHAMIEDPAIFLSLGLAPVWLWIPRLVAAIVAVQLLGLYRYMTRRRHLGRMAKSS